MAEFVVLSHSRPSHVTPGAGVVLGDAMALPGTKALEVAISAAVKMPRPTARCWFMTTTVGGKGPRPWDLPLMLVIWGM